MFDSFKHRVSQANNYLILADGYANGYEAARTRFEEARKQGIVDLLRCRPRHADPQTDRGRASQSYP